MFSYSLPRMFYVLYSTAQSAVRSHEKRKPATRSPRKHRKSGYKTADNYYRSARLPNKKAAKRLWSPYAVAAHLYEQSVHFQSEGGGGYVRHFFVEMACQFIFVPFIAFLQGREDAAF